MELLVEGMVFVLSAKPVRKVLVSVRRSQPFPTASIPEAAVSKAVLVTPRLLVPVPLKTQPGAAASRKLELMTVPAPNTAKPDNCKKTNPATTLVFSHPDKCLARIMSILPF